MRKALTIIAVAAAAALLAGGIWWFVSTGAYRDFDWRMVVI